jgi:hypothetical protein
MHLFGKPTFSIPLKSILIIFNYRFSSKENACQAICHVHGLRIHGCKTRCDWGRETIKKNPYSSVCLNEKTKINLSLLCR